MAVTKDEVRHIAALARLQLGEDDVGRLAGELSGILGHIDELRRADVSGVAEGAVGPGRAPYRDPARGPDPLLKPLSGIAPDFRDGFFVVPRVPGVAGDTEPESHA